MDQTLAFVTLFLGLASGPQDVELLVAKEVATVELRIDGEFCARLEEPPWVAECDFGPVLEPHHLEARAWDSSGVALARIEQWLNLPRPAAEAKLVVEPGRGGAGGVARLTWQSLTEEGPERIAVELDGVLLDAVDPSSIGLPPLDLDQLHFLRAEIDFPENISAVAEATFGGFYAENVSTELTAITVAVESGRIKGPEQLQGWLGLGGEPLQVVAVEKGSVDVVVVRSAAAVSGLTDLLRHEIDARQYRRSSSSRSVRFSHELSGDSRLHFLWPHSETRRQGDQVYELFPRSQELTPSDGGWLWLLARMRQPSYGSGAERFADAVAVAGLNAARYDRRRAVLAILGDGGFDASQMPSEMVRGYLSSIGVPLFVWTLGEAPEESGWGEVVAIQNVANLRRALRVLSKAVDRQRIVWLDGRLLPQRVELTSAAEGIRLVR